MPIFFQSLRSGSSGNCLALWNGTTSILIDLTAPRHDPSPIIRIA